MIHSDQGRAFESMLMKNMLDTFCINQSRTTAYHPQCDGMVERFNRSLLQLLSICGKRIRLGTLFINGLICL